MLELFYQKDCPYCNKVINYFQSQNINFIKKNVLEKQNYDELLTIGKINQVPFLVDTDNGLSMYESDSIISYAEKLLGNEK